MDDAIEKKLEELDKPVSNSIKLIDKEQQDMVDKAREIVEHFE